MAAWDTFTNQAQWEAVFEGTGQDQRSGTINNRTDLPKPDEEQMKGQSFEDNYIGFTKWDAEEMTAISPKDNP